MIRDLGKRELTKELVKCRSILLVREYFGVVAGPQLLKKRRQLSQKN